MGFVLVQELSQVGKLLGFVVDFVVYFRVDLSWVPQISEPDKIQYYSQFDCFYYHFSSRMGYLNVN